MLSAAASKMLKDNPWLQWTQAQNEDIPACRGTISGGTEVAAWRIHALISRKATSTLRVSAMENRSRKVSYIAFLSSLSSLILFKLDALLCRVLGGHLHISRLDTDSWDLRKCLQDTVRAPVNKAGRHQPRPRLPLAPCYLIFLSDMEWVHRRSSP